MIGFINSLVEHENNKIIIIADDEEFKNDPNYVAVKEKTIGTVVEYISDISLSFDVIIVSKYRATYELYYDFLVKEKENILDRFGITGTTNLRTLIYFLQHFHPIFSSLYDELKLGTDKSDPFGNKKLQWVLNFSVAITIEFKKGALSYQKRKGIDDMRSINLQISKNSLGNIFSENLRPQANSEPRPAERTYWEWFIDAYFNSEYEFYSPVFEFITGGNSFEAKLLVKALKCQFDNQSKTPKPQDIIFQKLGEPQVLDLSNEEYGKLTDKMLAYANEGAYPLAWYMAILIYTQRFPEIKKYPLPATSHRLIDYIKTNPSKFTYDDELRETFEDKKRYENDEEFQELWKAVNEVNNSLLESQLNKNRADLFLEFQNTPDEFYYKVKELPELPIFAYWDFNKFYEYFKSMPTSQIPRFRRFLKQRYEYMMKQRLEYFFLTSLFDEIQKFDPDEPKTLRRIALDKLADLLKEIIEKNTILKTRKN